jgi:hypothetical protein
MKGLKGKKDVGVKLERAASERIEIDGGKWPGGESEGAEASF